MKSTIMKYNIIEKGVNDVYEELREYSFEQVKDSFEPNLEEADEEDKEEIKKLHDKWEEIKDLYDLKEYLKEEYGGDEVPYIIVEAGERPLYKEKSISLGGSDIAALIAVGMVKSGDEQKLTSEIIRFGGDNNYNAWLVTDEDIEIPNHYSKMLEYHSWLKIYDDDGLVYKSAPMDKYFEIYQAGMYGLLIRALEKEPRVLNLSKEEKVKDIEEITEDKKKVKKQSKSR